MLPLHHDPASRRSRRLCRRCIMASPLFQQPVGDSNPCSRVENPASSPLDERAVAVGREALESSSAVFQTAATPSQLPTQRKRPGVLLRRLALQASSRGRCSASQARRVGGKAIRPRTSRTPGPGFPIIEVRFRHGPLAFRSLMRLSRVVHRHRRERRRLVREKNGLFSPTCAALPPMFIDAATSPPPPPFCKSAPSGRMPGPLR